MREACPPPHKSAMHHPLPKIHSLLKQLQANSNEPTPPISPYRFKKSQITTPFFQFCYNQQSIPTNALNILLKLTTPVAHTTHSTFYNSSGSIRHHSQFDTLGDSKESKRLQQFLNSPQIDQFESLVLAGSGGLEASSRYLVSALGNTFKKPVVVLDENMYKQTALFNSRKTLFVILSKSGLTLETRTLEQHICSTFLKPLNLLPQKHIMTLTTRGSPLDNPDHYLACFYLPKKLPGRLGCSSLLGTLIFGFARTHRTFTRFLNGARSYDSFLYTTPARQNPALLHALTTFWWRSLKAYEAWGILPYTTQLYEFPNLAQHLLMEGLGRSSEAGIQTCPFVFGHRGPKSFHWLYEWISETKRAFLDVIGVQSAIKDEPINMNICQHHIDLLLPTPMTLLLLNKLTPEAFGALIAHYEWLTTYLSTLWQCDAFSQPHTDASKRVHT